MSRTCRSLIDSLRTRGYRVLGPTLREGALVLAEVRHPRRTCPAGSVTRRHPGAYRTRDRGDEALFGFAATRTVGQAGPVPAG